MNKYTFTFLALIFSCFSYGQASGHSFRIRTITAGVNLSSLSDTASLLQAVEFLKVARTKYQNAGYEVQTIRIST